MTRPVCILIAAMGGEGGGVLADWLVDAATDAGFPVQSTSVPGVAQRTGSTTYYVEIFPETRDALGGREPVLALTPTPGEVDIVAASELVEAGRAIQSGYVTPSRSLLIASTHRDYAVAEKSAMGDGRYDSQRILDAAAASARRCMLFDMRAAAQQLQTVINTVLFGAMARSGLLPFSREACEAAIRRSGKSVDASLLGFAAGFDHTEAAPVRPPATSTRPPPEDRVAQLPIALHETVAAGVALTTDYQDAIYTSLYLDRVERVLSAEAAAGNDTWPVTRETARYLALWMAFEDVIRVADLKTRHDRIERVRREVGASPGEPLRITEFLKPGVDELCSVLPAPVSRQVRALLERRGRSLSRGMRLRTDTVLGFLALTAVRLLRPLRPRLARYAAEQAAIERWIKAVVATLASAPELALELALCGNLIKGYGDTHARGHRSLALVLDDIESRWALASGVPARPQVQGLSARVRAAREAALAEPDGVKLAATLGLPRPQALARPITFHKRRPPA